MVATALTCASETFMTLQFSDWLSQMSNTNPGVIIYRHCITNELLKVATGAEEGTSAQRSCAQRKVLEVLRVYCITVLTVHKDKAQTHCERILILY